MRAFKKVLAMLLVAFIMSASACAHAKESDVTVLLDGQTISFDVSPQMRGGRIMVPLRRIFEEIGAFVKWDSETQTISARKGSKTITMQIDSDEVQMDKGKTDENGNAVVETVTLDVPATIVSGRTLVPVRAVSESFGLEVDWDESSSTVLITSKQEDDAWKQNTGTIHLDDLTYTGSGVSVSGNQIFISEGGDFTVSGALADGTITVSAKDKVKLRLSGAEITASEGPCIYFEEADKAFITIENGTKNTLTAKNSEKGAVYSKDSLEIKGGGALDIVSEGGCGIKASDSFSIENGTLSIDAAHDGIHVNDTFKMSGAVVNIRTKADGIDSESIVAVSGGELNIETTAEPMSQGSSSAGQTQDFPFGRGEAAGVEFETSAKGIKAEWMLVISGGSIRVNSADHAIHCADEMEISGGSLNLCSNYAKGISAHGNLTVDGNNTVIDITKSTEGIESKNVLTVNDGTIKIVASDDGMNGTGGESGMGMMAPGGMRFGDGAAAFRENPAESRQEMMPGGRQRPNNGNLPGNISPSEEMSPPEGDGMPENFRGKGGRADRQQPDNASFGERKGMPDIGGARTNQKDALIINGGDIEIYAGDDCLDSNGNLVLNGGVIKAVKTNGSVTGNNSVLDAEGSIAVNEGVTLLAAVGSGTEGRLEISQNHVTVYSETVHEANSKIALKSETGKTLLEYTPQGGFRTVWFTAPQLNIGEKYVLSVENEEYRVEISGEETTVGTAPARAFGGRR